MSIDVQKSDGGNSKVSFTHSVLQLFYSWINLQKNANLWKQDTQLQ